MPNKDLTLNLPAGPDSEKPQNHGNTGLTLLTAFLVTAAFTVTVPVIKYCIYSVYPLILDDAYASTSSSGNARENVTSLIM